MIAFVAEITAYDPAISGTRVLRYSTVGFVTGAADTPAHTYYAERIRQPALMSRDMFAAGTTQGPSRIGYGDLVLENGDGELDGLLEYGFDGREIIIRRGEVGDAYPADFTTVLVATMQQPEVDFDAVTLKLRDRQQELAVPLQTNKYLGDNALPAGLEGVATDLKGKPKPLCYGVVKNVPAVLVNTSKLIYQVHDGPVASVDAVYDRGVRLGDLYIAASVMATVGLSWQGTAWDTRSTGAGVGDANDIVHGNGIWVLVGTGTLIYTSPDGITWTSRANGFTGSILGVTYGEGLFVAVGASGQLFSSPDGITWTSRVSQFGATSIISVLYANGIFMAVGLAGKVSTSVDGITWVAQAAVFAGTTVQDVAYGNGTWVIVGDKAAGDGKIAYSTDDGVTFTNATSTPPFASLSVFGIAFGAGVFVACGDIGSIGRSVDGITWVKVMSVGVQILLHVEYGNGLFLIGGFEGLIASSVDGFAFSQLVGTNTPYAPFGANSIRCIATTTALPGSYASETDLLDDTLAPLAGKYKVYLAGGYFRIGAAPAGLITADVTEGATAADRTTAQIFTRLLTTPLAAPLLEWRQADIAALDALEDAVLGLWVGTEEVTVASCVDLVAGSIGAWYGVNRNGVFRIVRFVAPSGSPVLSLTSNDLLRPLDRIVLNDPGAGIPTFKSVVRWGRFYTVQPTDVAGGVTADRRAELAKEWREATFTDATVQTAHPLAPQITEDSLLTVAADALAEATRRQALRGVRRDRFETTIALTGETEVLDLGDVIEVTHTRLGLSGGELFTVLGIAPNAERKDLTLTLWK